MTDDRDSSMITIILLLKKTMAELDRVNAAYEKSIYEIDPENEDYDWPGIVLFNEEYGQNVKIVKTPYRGVEYVKNLVPLKDEPEGGKRCHLCYRLRIEEGYQYAEEHGFDYYTTVMTISRQKDSRVMNEIGADLQKSYPNTRYFHSDFKKNGGLEKAAEIIKKYNIYSQNYCGCIFSYQEMLERVRNGL